MSRFPHKRLLQAEVNAFFGALMFLTQIPVAKFYHHEPDEQARSAVYFPVVGMLVGIFGGVVLVYANSTLPPFVAVLMAMGAMVALTGGLHEDGLADAADGLIGGQFVEERLEIMKDSRIGSYGTMALWFGFTSKLFLIESLLVKSLALAFGAVICANLLGRMAAVILLRFCRYVRPTASKAGSFGNSVSSRRVLVSGLYSILLTLLMLQWEAVPCIFAAIFVTWSAGHYFNQKLGGITGDCLGATNQIVELSCYLALLLSVQRVVQ